MVRSALKTQLSKMMELARKEKRLQKQIRQLRKSSKQQKTNKHEKTDVPLLQFKHTAARKWKQSVVTEEVYGVKINPQYNGRMVQDITKKLYKSFTRFITGLKQKHNLTATLARIQIDHSSLMRAILVPLQPLHDLDANQIMGNVERVLQSNENLALDTKFKMNVGLVHMPTGSGRMAITRIEDARIKKKSIYAINNSDNLCFARAVAVGLAHQNNYGEFRRLKHDNSQRKAAEKLHQATNVKAPVCFLDIPKFEEYLQTNIVVFAACSGNKVMYSNLKHSNSIYLWYVELEGKQHFDLILKPNAFLCCKFFCGLCLKGYDKRIKHICEEKCFCGLKSCSYKETVFCKDCNRYCRSVKCYAAHKKKRRNYPSLCSSLKICLKCKTPYKTSSKRPHVCGEWLCRSCLQYVNGHHKCYVRGNKPNKICCKYIDFDFETDQSSGVHVPNFVVAYKSCPTCIDIPTSEQQFCESCGERDIVFSGYNSAKEFGRWLFDEEHKYYTVRSHNGSGFDNVFLLEYLLSQSIIPDVIYNGSKIVYMFIKKNLHIRVIDSIKFLPMALANLPKAFGLEEQTKGYFPHYFNVRENQEYVGEMPQPEMYGCNQMPESKRIKFFEWYNQSKSKVFNFKEEIEKYCRSDVDILQRACNKFRKLILEITSQPIVNCNGKTVEIGVDPFQYTTIASVCMAIYQFCFLQDKYKMLVNGKWVCVTRRGAIYYDNNGLAVGNILTNEPIFVSSPIARISENLDTHSKSSIEWLEHEAKCRNVKIQHARNGGEVVWKKYKFDGFDSANQTVYEFYGCLWHGCPNCFPHTEKQLKHPHTGQSMKELYRQTMERQQILQDHGFNVVAVWEHEFKDFQQEHNISNTNFPERLRPRNAFYGGRTSVMTTYCKVSSGEKISYCDFTSLYTYVNKYCTYPVGHPEIYVDNFPSIENSFGLVQLDILPPRNLFHPVLPIRCRGKNMFVLCNTCAETESSACNCNPEKRMLSGTWDTLHLNKAIQLGYKVVKIYEMWVWKETTKDLFAGYSNNFIKLKQESSDWPSWVKTVDDEQTYINDYLKHESISLDKSQIKLNPGLRSVCKLLLNSLWGKFGENLNRTKTKIVSKPEDLVKLLVNQQISISDFNTMNEDLLQVSYNYCSDLVPEDGRTNVYVALFTTAHARLKLYTILETLGKRALYCDTDSVIYLSKTGDTDIKLGDYVGQMTNELDDGDHIVEFCAAAPKQYAYKTANGRVCCKAKGFSLNYDVANVLNFCTLRDMVLKDTNVEIQYNSIRRDKLKTLIVNKCEKKKCRLVINKRFRAGNVTYPFGYKLT